MRRIGFPVVTAIILAAAAAGCASTRPTPELVSARQAYVTASRGPASSLAPTSVAEARLALERAERAHGLDAGSWAERSLSYLALRKAELAMAHASIVQAEQDRAMAFAEADATLRERGIDDLTRTRAELERTRMELERVRRDLALQATVDDRTRDLTRRQGELEARQAELEAQTTQLQSRDAELSREREARMEAEKRAAAAIESLADVARVRQEARGTVITIQGQVLFTTGKADLLPIAEKTLDRVVEALKVIEPNKTILIAGHTDSRGSDQGNMKLSNERAESVRSYLVSKGIDASRVKAVGKGEEEPLTSNDTAEGRANNRRVEIIVSASDESLQQQPQPMQPQPMQQQQRR